MSRHAAVTLLSVLLLTVTSGLLLRHMGRLSRLIDHEIGPRSQRAAIRRAATVIAVWAMSLTLVLIAVGVGVLGAAWPAGAGLLVLVGVWVDRRTSV